MDGSVAEPVPKSLPFALRICQAPRYVPEIPGATRLTEMSMTCPGATLRDKLTEAGPPIWSPLKNTRL